MALFRRATDESTETRPPSARSCLGFAAVVLLAAIGVQLWQYHWPKATIELSGKTLTVLVAKTPAHQYRGLGRRETLAPYDGMLFLFATPQPAGIVMRDMRFPLDVVWLERGVVVDMAKNLPLEPGVPESSLRVYYPRQPVNIILELPAGWIDENGLKIGDRMRIIEG